MRLDLTHPGCEREHHSYASLAACHWPEAAWITGSGPVAFLTHCGMLSIQLFPDEATARRRCDTETGSRCSGECTGEHELVMLVHADVPARA